MKSLFFLLSLGSAAAYASPGYTYNVRDYGAIGDGVAKETVALCRTIDACEEAGGGVVEFPAGKYLTGTINLKSNITLHLNAGATIFGSLDVIDYPIIPNPWGPSDWQGPTQMSALIQADNVTNIAICGPGTIDGQGSIWWKRLWLSDKKKSPGKDTFGATVADAEYVKRNGGRPRLIRLVNCRQVAVRNISLINSPRWTVHPLFCDDVTIDGVKINNPANSPNTDAIDPESCRNVHISNCDINVGDDAITLKSGYDEVGRHKGRPTENVTITNCTIHRAHGGIVIGSEMSGDVRNVTVSNCVFQGTEKGIRIKSSRGRGGVVEGVTIDNLVMQDVVEAIDIVTFYFSKDTPDQIYPVTEATPRFRDIHISNVTARGSTRAGEILGLREMPVMDLSLENIRIRAKTGLSLQDASGIRLLNVEVDAEKGPAIDAERIAGLEIAGFRTSVQPPTGPVVIASDVVGLRITDALAPKGTDIFLEILGRSSRGITLQGSDLKFARQAIQLDPQVEPQQIRNN